MCAAVECAKAARDIPTWRRRKQRKEVPGVQLCHHSGHAKHNGGVFCSPQIHGEALQSLGAAGGSIVALAGVQDPIGPGAMQVIGSVLGTPSCTDIPTYKMPSRLMKGS